MKSINAYAQDAQAHSGERATRMAHLAIAQEQHVANLIALVELVEGDPALSEKIMSDILELTGYSSDRNE